MLILRSPRKHLELTRGPEDWKQFLAEPDKHWKDGRSAKLLAEAWEGAAPDMPRELRAAFVGTPFEAFEPVLAIPEYEVDLPGGSRPSQNDLFVLGRIGADLAVLMIEGKVDESFGPLLGEWLVDASPGKRERLAFLGSTLGLSGEVSPEIRYQLLHRAASPVVEARRLGARYAAMIVHSFSAVDACFDDYRAFAGLVGVSGAKGRLERAPGRSEPELWMAWVRGATASRSIPSPKTEATSPLPRLVAHADWGSDPRKRWMCVAERVAGGGYRVASPEPVGEPSRLLRRLRERADGERVLVGFDFPIGLPAAYAVRAGVSRFTDLLPNLGSAEWSEFYEVAERPNQIGLRRPFYPMRSGETKQEHLIDALGVTSMTDLLRTCDRPTGTRGAASSIFWTLGGKQVGKAAIIGWRNVLAPALRDASLDVGLWPFDGELDELLERRSIVVVETYPAEACTHLGLTPPGRG